MPDYSEQRGKINIIFHIWILFTFLTILFFTFISKTEKSVVTDKLDSAINDQVPTVLSYVDKMDKKFDPTHKGVINWDNVNKKGIELQKKYNKSDPSINKHNKNLIYLSIGLCVALLVILIGTILYYTLYKKYDINLKEILVENILIFAFVGVVEVLFFLNVALKYSPINNSDMVEDIVDRSEYQVNNQLS